MHPRAAPPTPQLPPPTQFFWAVMYSGLLIVKPAAARAPSAVDELMQALRDRAARLELRRVREQLLRCDRRRLPYAAGDPPEAASPLVRRLVRETVREDSYRESQGFAAAPPPTAARMRSTSAERHAAALLAETEPRIVARAEGAEEADEAAEMVQRTVGPVDDGARKGGRGDGYEQLDRMIADTINRRKARSSPQAAAPYIASSGRITFMRITDLTHRHHYFDKLVDERVSK